MNGGRLKSLAGLIVAVALVVAPASAQAITESATSGNVTATLSYEKGKFGLFTNVRETVSRGGVSVFDQAAPADPACPDCTPGPAYGGRSPSVRVLQLDKRAEPEVVFDLYTGGAHCCFYSQVLSHDGSTYTGVTHSWGDPGYTFADLDGDGIPEFKSADPAFAYAFGSFASSRFPPQIWRFDNGQFLNVTKQFPALIQADAARLQKQLKKFKGKRLFQFIAKPILAAYTADTCLLGSCDTGFALVSRTIKKGGIKHGAKFKRQLTKFLTRLGYLS